MKRLAWITATTLSLVLASISHAATYDWTGAGAGSDWDTVANWTVTGSADGWTWPNEQWGNEYTNEDADAINIINGDTVSRAGSTGWISIDGARDGSNTAVLTLDNSSTLATINSMWIADAGNTKGTVNVLGGSTLSVEGTLKSGDDALSVGTLTVTDSILSTTDHLVVANRAGSTGFFEMNGTADVDVGGTLYIADAGGVGTVTINSGTFDAGRIIVGDDGGTAADGFMTLNSGTVTVGGDAGLYVAWTTGADGLLTVNDGLVDIAANFFVGTNAGANAVVDLNGGVIQSDNLTFNDVGVINYGGGELRVNGTNVSVTDMENFVGAGQINTSGVSGFEVVSDSGFTVLREAAFSPLLNLTINRDTGQGSITNNTGQSQTIRGYSIVSEDGALTESNATFLADTDSGWVQLTEPGATSDLSEGHLTSDTFAEGTEINDFGDGAVWQKYYKDTSDISFQYVADDGSVVNGTVMFTGNGGDSFIEGDLNFDGLIDGQDWLVYVGNLGSMFPDQSAVQAYNVGDFDNNGANDHGDFLTFGGWFDAANGAGAFQTMLASVPEPSSLVLLALAAVGLIAGRRKRGL